ncbi:VCBS repeat-containing protein [Asanoa sp. WMMD1127]|uniref:FG-GAP repeat domain-containing protein n=1 Tax=Asanoa sp. WMMD1127 TaxID=3016107 RepID=UPI0024166C79|nr:VCBS repeat-containing protein [Asanoa sp. WMMD1127]MDG4825044.1 VCBS repeat-containing protein [Asanoa sp. WMMD1127]
MPRRTIRKAAVAISVMLAAQVCLVGVAASPASAALRDDIVTTAKRELNDSSRNYEDGNNCTYYSGQVTGWPVCNSRGWRGGGDDYQWCANFAKFVWQDGGVDDLAGLNAWAFSFAKYGNARGTLHPVGDGYRPKPGDAVVFDWEGTRINLNNIGNMSDTALRDIDHVGIVVSYNASTGGVNTIEGNTDDAVKARSRTTPDIRGYIAPAGAEEPVEYRPSTDSSRLRADFTGDGLDDVGLFYDYGGGRVALWVMRGVAGGGLTPPVRWWEDVDWGSNTRYVSTGDFNADGKADVAMFYQYPTPGRVALWTLTSLGDRFEAPKSRWDDTDWGNNTSFMTTGDYNGDGRADIGVLYDYPGSRTAFWTLTADGSDADGRGFGAPVVRWNDTDFGSNTKFAGSGDFNGDGRSDLALFYDYGDRHVAVWTLTSTAGGGFATPVRRWDGPVWGGGTQFMTVGKFVNGDNKADIGLFYDYGDGHVRLFTLAADTAGSGAFGPPVGRWDDVDFGGNTAFMTATQISSTSYDDIQLFYQYDGPHVAVWTITPGAGAYNTVTRRWDDIDWGGRTRTML